jgi:hypothetical protein
VVNLTLRYFYVTRTNSELPDVRNRDISASGNCINRWAHVMDSANSVMTLLVTNCKRTMINVPTEAQNKYTHWETDLPTNNTIY